MSSGHDMASAPLNTLRDCTHDSCMKLGSLTFHYGVEKGSRGASCPCGPVSSYLVAVGRETFSSVAAHAPANTPSSHSCEQP